LIDKRISIIKGVLRHPKQALQEIDSAGNYYFGGAIALLIFWSIVEGVMGYQVIGSIDLSYGIKDALYTFSLTFLFIILTYYIGRRLKGIAKFRNIFSTIMYSSIPGDIGFSILYPPIYLMQNQDGTALAYALLALLGIGLLVTLPFVIWGIILNIFACSESHKFSKKRSFAVMIISLIITLGIFNGIQYAIDPTYFSWLMEDFPLNFL